MFSDRRYGFSGLKLKIFDGKMTAVASLSLG